MVRGLVRRGAEVPVAKTALAARQQQQLLSMFGDFADFFAGYIVAHDHAKGNIEDGVLAITAFAFGAFAVVAVFCGDKFAVFQVQQGPELGVPPEDHTSAIATITTIRATEGHVFLTPPMDDSFPPVAALEIDLYVVNK